MAGEEWSYLLYEKEKPRLNTPCTLLRHRFPLRALAPLPAFTFTPFAHIRVRALPLCHFALRMLRARCVPLPLALSAAPRATPHGNSSARLYRSLYGVLAVARTCVLRAYFLCSFCRAAAVSFHFTRLAHIYLARARTPRIFCLPRVGR